MYSYLPNPVFSFPVSVSRRRTLPSMQLDRIDRPAEITIHGELVHNEAVLTQLGRRTVSARERRPVSARQPPPISQLAHVSPPSRCYFQKG